VEPRQAWGRAGVATLERYMKSQIQHYGDQKVDMRTDDPTGADGRGFWDAVTEDA
jgi:hypothetical protein